MSDDRLKFLEEQNVTLQSELQKLLEIAQPLQEQNALLQARLQEPAANNQPFPSYQVAKLAAKLPPFWADRPTVWFAQVETQFRLAGIITEETKFDHVVSKLETRIIGEVEDIITNPPASNRYGKLKSELIRRLSTSEEQRVRQLVSDEELGDRRPSQFLRHLRSLAGNALSDEKILRQLWMRRLPPHIQAILAAQDLPLDKIAELADKILDVSPGEITFQPQPQAAVYSAEIDFLARLDALTRQVASLTADRERVRSRSSSRTRSQAALNRPSSSSGKKGICWYHKRFGDKASKCTTPCQWKPAENSNSNQ